ncbi:type VI secretion system protein VasG [Paraburkholderia lycopersici]|uniref:Type VI secretion system protein VasG n=2 Tax=Paraburkholderia lycopersici TaxID=416944 RepID=A0A1G6XTK4_9BURK|nr:type VI secretion system protein VasG [Paraburkholderia lycopersici]
MISRSILFSKLNSWLLKSLENSTALCKLRGNPQVELVHWLHQLMQGSDTDLQVIVRHFGLDEKALREDIVRELDRLPRSDSAASDLSPEIDGAVERGWFHASLRSGKAWMRSADLLLGILNTTNLRNHLHRISPQFAHIEAKALEAQYGLLLASSSEGNVAQSGGAARGAGTEASGNAPAGGPQGNGSLQRYAVDLTEKAKLDEIDPVVGRDEEIRQIVDILMRRRQNNPLLTGEAGVGKTAIVEGLALRIARGDVPPALRDVRLWQLDMGLMQAGAGMKGEFETRLQGVIHEVQSSPAPIVLFIDEIHTLVGAGGAAGTGDAANLMKPALSRGQLRTIGATTWSEYKKYIEKDPALTRRFQAVQIMEPSEKQAMTMLRHTVSTLERHHQVLLLDEAIEAAVRLSHRYIPARQLPDKAVSLLDTACARVAVSQHAEPAQVEDCRRLIEALELELGIVAREQHIGIEHEERVRQVRQKLDDERAALAALQVRWERERDLARQIIELRRQLRDRPAPDDTAMQAAVSPDTAKQAIPEAVPAGGSDTADEIALPDIKDDEPVPVPLDAQRAKLAVLQAELGACQLDAPLIFPAVDANTVATVVADWTGIPLGRMMKDEIDAVLNLTETLSRRVIGQTRGLDLMARRVLSSRAKLDDPDKPVGVFLLCGPSGVGKTETAFALAEALYGGEQNVVSINMSEFQEAHTVSTLKGAPPGYVGYGEGGVLTEAVRRRPYSVVLLDEIEKAHPDVHEIFFQVFDKGWMEDGEGRHIDFRNTIIILTSNVGAEVFLQHCSPGAAWPDADALTEALREPLLEAFPAALLGRLRVVPYYPLNDGTLAQIVRLQLARIQQRLLDNHQIRSRYDDALVQQVVARCNEPESGGRMVDAILVNQLLPRISHALLTATQQGQRYRTLCIGMDDDTFTCEFEI